MGYLWGIGLALLAAVGVIVAANATGDGRTSAREFWADLRSGLRRRGARDDAAGAEGDAEPVDVPFAQMFAESSEPDDGYLQLDELAEMIERTGERAGRILPGRGEHGHRTAHPEQAEHPAAAPVAGEPAHDTPHAPHPRTTPRAHPAPVRRSGHEPAARRTGTATAHAPAASAPLPPAVPPQRRDG
jgi:hypothetical protein